MNYYPKIVLPYQFFLVILQLDKLIDRLVRKRIKANSDNVNFDNSQTQGIKENDAHLVVS